MITVTISNLSCVMLDDTLSHELAALGENVSALNCLTWPPGASNHAHGTFIMHSADWASLAANNRANAVNLRLIDDSLPAASGSITLPMYLLEARPIHISNVGSNYPALYAVTLVDRRYFWSGYLTSASYNVTTSSDRTTYYTATSGATWSSLLDSLFGIMSVSVDLTAVTGTVGDPIDFLFYNEPAGIAIDRVCSALGLLTIANLDGTFAVVVPNSLNSDALKHNDQFLQNRMAGGYYRSAGTADGQAWLNAVMPSSVTVRFPRQMPPGLADTAGSANPPPLSQFYIATSTSGLPINTTGRPGYSVVLNDTLWAVGPIGAETNASALQARANWLATNFYNRYRVTLHDVRLMGFINPGPIVGIICWRATPAGPFTEWHVSDLLGVYGGNRDVGEGFNKKNVIGLGGIQTHRTFDGSLVINNTNAVGGAWGTITGHSGSFPQWTYTLTLTGATVTGTNGCETSGSPNYTYGNGVLITSSSGQANSTACVIQPIGTGAVVWVVPNGTSNWFSTPNSAQ